MKRKRPLSTKSDGQYLKTLENHLNWCIFSGISLGAASGLWRYIELGRAISEEEVPRILAGTWPRGETPISGTLIRWSIPFMFLAGLGIECLLKAIRILQFRASGKAAATKNRRGSLALAAELKTHDLVGLAEAAGITLDATETKLLERLTDFVEWAGRYPVGVAADQTTTDAAAHFATDRDAVFALASKLRAEVERLDPNRELYEQMDKAIHGEGPPSSMTGSKAGSVPSAVVRRVTTEGKKPRKA